MSCFDVPYAQTLKLLIVSSRNDTLESPTIFAVRLLLHFYLIPDSILPSMTSPSTHRSSSSRPSRGFSPPHGPPYSAGRDLTTERAAVAALKRNLKIPLKKKVGPRLTLLREKKALAGTMKTPLLKTKTGSISKIRRVFPGASSSSTTSTGLRDTGWSKLSNADKLTFKKYFEKCGGQFPESTMDEVKPVTTDKPSAKKRRVRVPAKDLEAFRAFQKARKSQHESPVLE